MSHPFVKKMRLSVVSLLTVLLLAACGDGEPIEDPATEPLDDPVEDPADPSIDPAEEDEEQDEEDMEGPGADTP